MTITEAKQRLELPALLHREGLGAHAKKSARCPFHDDQHNSFSIYKNGSGDWRWKCFSQCGTGDEINFFEKLRGISSRDATKLFIVMADGLPNGSTPTAKKSPAKHSKPLDWQACVDAFTDEHLARLSEWRGYSGELCSWLEKMRLLDCTTTALRFRFAMNPGPWLRPITD
jgi:CHC2 zinc finger